MKQIILTLFSFFVCLKMTAQFCAIGCSINESMLCAIFCQLRIMLHIFAKKLYKLHIDYFCGNVSGNVVGNVLRTRLRYAILR